MKLKGRPFHLILDWDGTMTHKDTMHFLGRIGTRKQYLLSTAQSPILSSEAQKKEEHERNAPKKKDMWGEIVQQYIEDYGNFVRAYKPEKAQRVHVDQERAWLASLKEIECQSVRRVERFGLFRGVTAADIKQGARDAIRGGELKLRSGWAGLLLLAREHQNSQEQQQQQQQQTQISNNTKSRVSILSVNWSTLFIRECLLQAAEAVTLPSDRDQEALRQVILEMDIYANEIDGLEEPDGSSGQLNERSSTTSGLRTSEDKLMRIRSLTSCEKEAEGEDQLIEKSLSLYVGDSTTDFDALLAPDVGICVRDHPMGSGQKDLADSLLRVHVPVHHPLGDGLQLLSSRAPSDPLLFWVDDLNEICKFIRESL